MNNFRHESSDKIFSFFIVLVVVAFLIGMCTDSSSRRNNNSTDLEERQTRALESIAQSLRDISRKTK